MRSFDGVRDVLRLPEGDVTIFRLDRLAESLGISLDRLPFSIRILLENAVRNVDGFLVHEEDVEAIGRWKPKPEGREIPYKPARVVLQDFTGVPAVVDLAAMRSAVARMGGDPEKINPVIPADLIIDHSVQVDYFGTAYAFFKNVDLEYQRNRERYVLLKWAQKAFKNFRVVPPGTGIIHQVNLEYLAEVVIVRDGIAFPDTLLGTDSHTTMINGIGVLGWGVGGIEAEAVMLGQPYYMVLPEVIGVRLTGELPEGATATDLVLTVTEMLRKYGVVDKFVEFFGPGLSSLSVPDRATIANMAPEYGATMGFFPVDEATLDYLRSTARAHLVERVERYLKTQYLFRTDETPEPDYTDVLELDLATVEPSVAGPRRPQDRIPLREVKSRFLNTLKEFGHDTHPNGDTWEGEGGTATAVRHAVQVSIKDEVVTLRDGSVVIAAITSCTNTSNPSVMIGAGLVAKKAVERGLDVKPYVKTSLAPGSRVVTDYLERAGLLEFLEALRFHVVGYGCTTCIGNSGPLPPAIEKAIKEGDLVVASVLSGNRNFEARIHPLVRANFLASPMMVVAYAIAGRIDIDFEHEPLGFDPNGDPVYLRDIWPSMKEIRETVESVLDPELFRKKYATVFEGDERWEALDAPKGTLYTWDPNSTYIQEPPYFLDMPLEPEDPKDIENARVLVFLGDSVTTDHISPAGSIPLHSPAAKYLMERGVEPHEFNTFGARRGNHEVMIRGTFGNVRLKNKLVPGVEGGYTLNFLNGQRTTIFEAAEAYKKSGIPLLVIAGKEYGTGSSRDWAAKGIALLGIKAVIAESFERIHRSNLVGMGVLPLEFLPGENAQTLGLDGTEVYTIRGISEGLTQGKLLTVEAKKDGSAVTFQVKTRLDTPVEVEYHRHGGILQFVLRRMMKA